MKTHTPATWRVAALVALSGTTLLLAYDIGGVAYTKRVETNLLAEPKPLAASSGKLAYGRKVKIEEVSGNWLRISDGPASGWVFSGNLSETKLTESNGLDIVNLAAGKTTATAAERGFNENLDRPLSDNAKEYASGHNLDSAYEDLQWLMEQCRAFTAEEVDAYLQAQKKGEYQ